MALLVSRWSEMSIEAVVVLLSRRHHALRAITSDRTQSEVRWIATTLIMLSNYQADTENTYRHTGLWHRDTSYNPRSPLVLSKSC